MKVLITGAAGYLGQGIGKPFEARHTLRLMDIVPFESSHETFIGDVADLDACRRAVAGVDAVVIAHMASRQAGAYETPTLPFDANVKGTANLFFAGVQAGVRRFVLVSSSAPLRPRPLRAPGPLPPERRGRGTNFYGLSKVCQEKIAEHFYQCCDIRVAVIRFGWIMDADTMIDKYGEQRTKYGDSMVDRRDIGEAARLALELPDLSYEVFHLMGPPERVNYPEVVETMKRLNWQPKYDFSVYERA